jgi:hypothetical protein
MTAQIFDWFLMGMTLSFMAHLVCFTFGLPRRMWRLLRRLV